MKETRESHIEDNLDAILDLCYVFDAIYTILMSGIEPGPGTYYDQTIRFLQTKYLELYDLLEEMWIKYDYFTAYDVIDEPDSIGLLHTTQVNDMSILDMEEFIITIDTKKREMVITIAHGGEGVNETLVPISLDEINLFKHLINKVNN